LVATAEATRGDLSKLVYISARQMDLRAVRTLGLDAYIDRHRLDAELFPGTAGGAIAAKAGYRGVQVPAEQTTQARRPPQASRGSALSTRGSYCERAARGSLGVTSKAKWKAGRSSPGWSCA
jgi:hypothetical protein